MKKTSERKRVKAHYIPNNMLMNFVKENLNNISTIYMPYIDFLYSIMLQSSSLFISTQLRVSKTKAWLCPSVTIHLSNHW